jgi:tetratricopeptide (TPR) repeat protein
MNKAHYAASLSQKDSTQVDIGVFLRTTIARISTCHLWINTHFAWSEMPEIVNDSPAQACFEAGMAWYECGEYDQAVTEFRAALQLDWRHEGALKWIAIAEASAKGEDSKVALYPSALELSGLNRLS